MLAHRRGEAIEVGVVGALEVAGDQRAFGRRQRRRAARFRSWRSRTRSWRGTLAATTGHVRLGELDERAVVGRVARPGAAGLQELLLGDPSRQVGVERRLHVALEHLERHVTGTFRRSEPLEQGRLEPVRVRIVVLLADEHDVGVRQVGEHRLRSR